MSPSRTPTSAGSTGPGSRTEQPVATAPRPLRHALRSLAFGVVVAATVVATLGVAPAPVSAMPTVVVENALPTNTMARVVTASSSQALDSFDRWLVTGDASDERSYVWHRTQTARYAATEIGYPRDAMVDAWADAPIRHQLAVLGAMTQIGVPYRYNTSAAGVGFDCSGITKFAWDRAGVALVHQSSGQINAAASIDRSSAKAGDLVQYPGHVMMYLGVGDAVVHSVQTGRTVELGTISSRRAASVRFGDPTG